MSIGGPPQLLRATLDIWSPPPTEELAVDFPEPLSSRSQKTKHSIDAQSLSRRKVRTLLLLRFTVYPF